ncbi:glutathionylspermidine synthase family protein [Azotosporobacter soli]|uniref:glutathionylspermidine synthase family protein n=1 Tax=Azotosporobacter soli TaxID=3055040 RepID=UPI0031FE515F
MNYSAHREAIYQPLREKGIFNWDRMYGQEYALPHCLALEEKQCKEIRTAVEQMGAIIDTTVRVLQVADDELLFAIGVPEAALGAVRRISKWTKTTLLGRFDFAQTADGLKMIEFNADTPSGVVEAFHVNGSVCSYWQKKDPNAGMAERIRDVFACWRMAEQIGEDSVDVFSALGWHEEDAGNTRYLMKQSGWPATFFSLHELMVSERGVFVAAADALRKVDVLFRMHPLELLSRDCSEDGERIGATLLRLAAQGKVRLVNPATALLGQTKALQALIWAAFESGDYYDKAQTATIERYMLPTYFENRFHARAAYVEKPLLGREGQGVRLYDAQGRCEFGTQESQYDDQSKIYQKRVELERCRVQTEQGDFEGCLLWGGFILGGVASAILARVGGQITDDMAYYQPICLRK